MTTPSSDEALWRNRFLLINLTRIGGAVLALVGVLLWQSDTFVEGGHIAGMPLALAGVAISFLGPHWLVRRWRTPPGP